MAAARASLRPQNYEGCGRLGPIRSIFYAGFDATRGPEVKITVPENTEPINVVTKEIFDTIQVFVIPKPEMNRTTLTLTTGDKKILGFPIILKDPKYERNQFMFNVCFVCYHWSKTVNYESALIKLNKFLTDLEIDCQFLSSGQHDDELKALLEQIFNDLNSEGESTAVVLDTWRLDVKIVSNNPDPPVVNDWEVPVLMTNEAVDLTDDEWDLTSKQIIPHIDGLRYVKAISILSGVDNNLVKACIQNLIFHKLVRMVPIFMYRNVYVLNPKFIELKNDPDLRNRCLKYIKHNPKLAAPQVIRPVYTMVAAFNHTTTMIDIVNEFRPIENINVCDKKLVRFLLLEGIIRKLKLFPVYNPQNNENANVDGPASEYYHLMDGHHTYDQICVMTGLSPQELENMVDNDVNIDVLRQ